jgi:hypothetical protein
MEEDEHKSSKARTASFPVNCSNIEKLLFFSDFSEREVKLYALQIQQICLQIELELEEYGPFSAHSIKRFKKAMG